MEMKLLPSSTIKLIGSSQVITSVSSAVKELIENSIDAGAQNIEIRLENYGLDRIEVKDDGCGISSEDVKVMCQRSYTSKISDFSDLDKLESYGFRGEALNSLCAVGRVSVTTKTTSDEIGRIYFLDNDGKVQDSKASAIEKGTIIAVESLFRKLPVRRQILSGTRKKSEGMKKTEAIVKSLSIIHPRLRISLIHNKFCIWQKFKVPTLRQSLIQALPPTMVKQLHDINYSDEEMTVDMLIPKIDCNLQIVSCNGTDNQYLFINKRPVKEKSIEKAIQEEIFQFFGHYIPEGKNPVWLVSIKLPPDGLDVNLEPNKTKVLIKDMDPLVLKLRNQLITYYVGQMEGPKAAEKSPNEKKLAVKRKAEVEGNEISVKKDKHEDESLSRSEEIDFTLNEAITSTQNSITKFTENISGNGSISVEDPRKDVFVDQLPLDVVLEPSSSQETSEKDEITDLFESFDFMSDSDDGVSNVVHKEEKSVSITISKEKEEEKPMTIFQALSSRSIFDEEERTKKSINGEITLSQWSRGEIFCDKQPICPIEIGGQVINKNEKHIILPENKVLLEKEDQGKEDADEKYSESMDIPEINNLVKMDALAPNNDGLRVKEAHREAEGFQKKKDNPKEEFEKKHIPDKDILERSVSSQMGCKEMSAFTKFAREMKSKILEQTPGASFTKVASELASCWRNLQNEEKEKYKELAKMEKLKKLENKKEISPNHNQSKLKVVEISKPEERPIKKKAYCKTQVVEISCSKIKDLIDKRSKKIPEVRIIGTMQNGVIYCKAGSDIGALSVKRLHEALTFHNNMKYMTLPVKVLEKSLPVDEVNIQEPLWTILSCMETSIDTKCGTIIISDERITKNGFRIEVIEESDGRKFRITDIASQISYYDVQDLEEILKLIKNNGSNNKLEECRPLKVISYIRSETIRSLDKSKSIADNPNLCDSIKYWARTIKNFNQDCPHHKPVMQIIR